MKNGNCTTLEEDLRHHRRMMDLYAIKTHWFKKTMDTEDLPEETKEQARERIEAIDEDIETERKTHDTLIEEMTRSE